ncbi:GNAT family N-acetyltransferase [Vibrio astriarenae]
MSKSDLPVATLMSQLETAHHRLGFYLCGSVVWADRVVQSFSDYFSAPRIAFLGGVGDEAHRCIHFKKGEQLLGQELDLLIVDFSSGFDANSFTAALGALVGGGVLIVRPWRSDQTNPAQQWLAQCLNQLIVLDESQPCSLPHYQVDSIDSTASLFAEQNEAIERLVNVVEGHRKRPFVLTADRGRGKSSALGIAAARLMASRQIRIAVTAPQLKSVQPVFSHAQQQLDITAKNKGRLEFGASSLEFIAPDELLRTCKEFDFVMVDEAAAIPLPLLEAMVTRFHRLAFSSTVHGYEGSGRGFTLKFVDWLKKTRSGMRQMHLTQPIRWQCNDPLESWAFASFLLDAESQQVDVDSDICPDDLLFSSHSPSELLANKHLLRQAFALLVNAHYQTTPNDLFSLLGDTQSQLYTLYSKQQLVGCLLTVKEGELSEELITDIALGRRRPKGQLVCASLITHLGMHEFGLYMSERVMRIAVQPQWQGRGLGSLMIEHLSQITEAKALTTSFGMTDELVRFWQANQFQPLKLGSTRDAASGTYSLIMARALSLSSAIRTDYYPRQAPDWMLDRGEYLAPDLIRELMPPTKYSTVASDRQLVTNFANGGSNIESCAFVLHDWLSSLTKQQRQACSDLLLLHILCRLSVEACCQRFSLTGRKQFDKQIRQDVLQLLQVS